MGTRGRRPKPIELREAEGNLGRRPLPARVETEPLEIPPPAILGEAGRELWIELVGSLGPVGALAAVDRVGLTAFCIQWDRAVDAARVLEAQGSFAQGSMGQLAVHPAIRIEQGAHDRLLKFAAEFAATPVARARIATANAARRQQDEFEDIVDAEPAEAEEIDADAL